MERIKKPSRAIVLWAQFAFLAAAGLIAVGFLVAGGADGKAGGSALLWVTLDRINALRGH